MDECPKCANCGLEKSKHQLNTLACPVGITYPGHYVYSDTFKFEQIKEDQNLIQND